MGGPSNSSAKLLGPRLSVGVAIACVVLWKFPLFHVRPLSTPITAAGALDVSAAAEKFWTEELPTARADDAVTICAALQINSAEAIKTHARVVGLGSAYFFLHGEGRITARNRHAVQLTLGEGADAPVVELEIGPIFGNTVRDATGLLDVNRFSSLQDFNALAAELNQRVESRVLPPLRDRAQVGVRVSFTGGAEAVAANPGRPLLTIIPTRVELR